MRGWWWGCKGGGDDDNEAQVARATVVDEPLYGDGPSTPSHPSQVVRFTSCLSVVPHQYITAVSMVNWHPVGVIVNDGGERCKDGCLKNQVIV